MQHLHVDIDLTKPKPLLVKCAGCGHWIEIEPTRKTVVKLRDYAYPPGHDASDVRTLCEVCFKQMWDAVNG